MHVEIERLKRLYTLRQPEKVIQFLESRVYLIPLLEQTYTKISECFEPSPKVILEVICDPEAADDCQLVAFVRADLEADDVLDKLDRFDKIWGYELTRLSQGNMLVHVEH